MSTFQFNALEHCENWFQNIFQKDFGYYRETQYPEVIEYFFYQATSEQIEAIFKDTYGENVLQEEPEIIENITHFLLILNKQDDMYALEVFPCASDSSTDYESGGLFTLFSEDIIESKKKYDEFLINLIKGKKLK